ncbi:TPA: hypothetical protein QCR51_005192 [Bacillus cereus]|nr:hypothetical protein [Bacillus cereus]
MMLVRIRTYEKIIYTLCSWGKMYMNESWSHPKIRNLVQEWYIANYESYEMKYNESTIHLRKEKLDFNIEAICKNRHELLKALHSIRYNIEHEEFEESKAYEELEYLIEVVSEDILIHHPEYEQAEWA